jgi:hypothetical protein
MLLFDQTASDPTRSWLVWCGEGNHFQSFVQSSKLSTHLFELLHDLRRHILESWISSALPRRIVAIIVVIIIVLEWIVLGHFQIIMCEIPDTEGDLVSHVGLEIPSRLLVPFDQRVVFLGNQVGGLDIGSIVELFPLVETFPGVNLLATRGVIGLGDFLR